MAEWKTSLRQTFRLLPQPSSNLQLMLEADGLTEEAVLDQMQYHAERAGTRGAGTGRPDPKRYRDSRQVFRSAGLLYERNGVLHVTPLGHATLWWLDKLTEKNTPVLARFAVYSLAAWQLRSPLPEARDYAADVNVFPFAFIWRVMLGVGGKINSMELKCEVMRLGNEAEIAPAIVRIMEYRRTGNAAVMLPPVVVDTDDRIIPWMALASFGWALIADKRDSQDGYYHIRPGAWRVLERAADIRHPHREFPDDVSYLEHIERAAAIPEDLR